MTETKLTDRQREFASANYKVMEDFLKYRGLPMDEFYDVVVFRVLRAVKQYDEREDPKRNSFSEIANNQMRAALSDYFARKERERQFRILSLDYPLATDHNLTLGDTIADESVDVCEEVCEKLSFGQEWPGLLHTYSEVCPTGQTVYEGVVCI